MKKILFCIDSLKPGGAEIIMCNTVNELVKDSNLDITVQLLQKEQKLNLDEKVKVNTFMNNNIFYRRIIKWMPASILHKLIIKEKYDYEIAFMEGASTKVISGCHNKKTKTYAWIHTDMEKYRWSQRSYRSVKEEKRAYSNIDRIFAVSSDTRDIFEKKYNKPATYVQNILNDKKINICADKEKNIYGDHQFHIVSVGSIKPIKGYERLIKVHRALKNEGVKCVHYILGDGPSYADLKQKITENDLEDRIILKGYIENPYPWIKEADMLACVSYAEGYSSVVCEAVILGVPVITTECSGMKDILGDSEYGLIVKNDDISIINGIKKMVTNKEFYQKYLLKVKERRTEFSVDNAVKQLKTKLEI